MPSVFDILSELDQRASLNPLPVPKFAPQPYEKGPDAEDLLGRLDRGEDIVPEGDQFPGLTPGQPVAGKLDLTFRIFDVLGQPVRRTVAAAQAGGTAGQISRAFWKGLTEFDDYYSGKQALEEMGVEDPGFFWSWAFEVGTDPLTLLPAGAFTKTGKAAVGAGKGAAVKLLSGSVRGQKVLAGARRAGTIAETSLLMPVRRYLSKYPIPMPGASRRALKEWTDMADGSMAAVARDYMDAGLAEAAESVGNLPNGKLLSFIEKQAPEIKDAAERYARLDDLFKEGPWFQLSKKDPKNYERIRQSAQQLIALNDPETMNLMRVRGVEAVLSEHLGMAHTEIQAMNANMARKALYPLEDYAKEILGDEWQTGMTRLFHIMESPPATYAEALSSLEGMDPRLRGFVIFGREYFDKSVPQFKARYGMGHAQLHGEWLRERAELIEKLPVLRARGLAGLEKSARAGALGQVSRMEQMVKDVGVDEAVRRARDDFDLLARQKEFFGEFIDSLDAVETGMSPGLLRTLQQRSDVLLVSKADIDKGVRAARKQGVANLENLLPEQQRLREYILGGGKFVDDIDNKDYYGMLHQNYQGGPYPAGGNMKHIDVAASEFGYEGVHRVGYQGMTMDPREIMMDDIKTLSKRGAFYRSEKGARYVRPRQEVAKEVMDEIVARTKKTVVFEDVEPTEFAFLSSVQKGLQGGGVGMPKLARSLAGKGRRAVSKIEKRMAENATFVRAAEGVQATQVVGRPPTVNLLEQLAGEKARLKRSLTKSVERIMAKTDPMTNPRLKQLNEAIDNAPQYVRRLLTLESRNILLKKKQFHDWVKDALPRYNARGGEWSTALSEHIRRKFPDELTVAEINTMVQDNPDKFIRLLFDDRAVLREDVADWLQAIAKKDGPLKGGMFLTDPLLAMASNQSSLNKGLAAKHFLHGLKDKGLVVPEQMRQTMIGAGHTDVAHWIGADVHRIDELKGWIMDPDLARAVNWHVTQLSDDGLVNQVGRQYQSLLNKWKGTVLMRPGYHVRNKAEDVFKNALYGGVRNPKRYTDTMSIQHAVDPAIVELQRKTAGSRYRAVRAISKALPDPETADVSKLWFRTQYGRVNGNTVGQWMLEDGVLGFHGMASVEARQLREPGQKLGKYASALEYNRLAGAVNENNSRGALYLNGLVNGKSRREARRMVAEISFDYDMLTKEQAQLKRWVIPFLTFRLKNAQLQGRMMVEKRRLYNSMVKTLSALEQRQEPGAELAPDWIREQVGIPVHELPDGTKEYFLLGNWLGVGEILSLTRRFGLGFDERSTLPWHSLQDVVRSGFSETVIEANPLFANVFGGYLMGYDPWRKEPTEDPAIEDYGGEVVRFMGKIMRKRTAYLLKIAPQLRAADIWIERGRRKMAGVEQAGSINPLRTGLEQIGVRVYGVEPRRAARYQKWQFEETERAIKSRVKGARRRGDQRLADHYLRQLQQLYAERRR